MNLVAPYQTVGGISIRADGLLEDVNCEMKAMQQWIPVAGGHDVDSGFGRITVGDAGAWLKQDNCSILLPDDLRLCICRHTKGAYNA